MKKEDKKSEIHSLIERFSRANFFYITDSSSLSVGEVNKLRRACYKAGIEMRVAKNTFIRKALEANNKITPELEKALSGPTSILFSDSANAPAKLIKDFRKTSEKPVLKAAWIDASVYVGDKEVATLAALKSKEELIGEILAALQAPPKNVISALLSGGQKLSGILKTLESRKAE